MSHLSGKVGFEKYSWALWVFALDAVMVVFVRGISVGFIKEYSIMSKGMLCLLQSFIGFKLLDHFRMIRHSIGMTYDSIFFSPSTSKIFVHECVFKINEIARNT